MARNDVKIKESPYNPIPTRVFKVQDRTSSSDTQLLVGEPVKILAGQGGNYAGHLATGDPEIGTDIVLGIVAKDSTETSSADGEVEVYLPLPGMVYECAATTPANLATGILLDTVTFDLTSTTFTVDEDEGSDENVHGLRIVDYDTAKGTVDFEIKNGATRYGDLV